MSRHLASRRRQVVRRPRTQRLVDIDHRDMWGDLTTPRDDSRTLVIIPRDSWRQLPTTWGILTYKIARRGGAAEPRRTTDSDLEPYHSSKRHSPVRGRVTFGFGFGFGLHRKGNTRRRHVTTRRDACRDVLQHPVTSPHETLRCLS